jgi:hypothetical protein
VVGSDGGFGSLLTSLSDAIAEAASGAGLEGLNPLSELGHNVGQLDGHLPHDCEDESSDVGKFGLGGIVMAAVEGILQAAFDVVCVHGRTLGAGSTFAHGVLPHCRAAAAASRTAWSPGSPTRRDRTSDPARRRCRSRHCRSGHSRRLRAVVTPVHDDGSCAARHDRQSYSAACLLIVTHG